MRGESKGYESPLWSCFFPAYSPLVSKELRSYSWTLVFLSVFDKKILFNFLIEIIAIRTFLSCRARSTPRWWETQTMSSVIKENLLFPQVRVIHSFHLSRSLHHPNVAVASTRWADSHSSIWKPPLKTSTYIFISTGQMFVIRAQLASRMVGKFNLFSGWPGIQVKSGFVLLLLMWLDYSIWVWRFGLPVF